MIICRYSTFVECSISRKSPRINSKVNEREPREETSVKYLWVSYTVGESARVRSELLEHRRAININIHFIFTVWWTSWKFLNTIEKSGSYTWRLKCNTLRDLHYMYICFYHLPLPIKYIQTTESYMCNSLKKKKKKPPFMPVSLFYKYHFVNRVNSNLILFTRSCIRAWIWMLLVHMYRYVDKRISLTAIY